MLDGFTSIALKNQKAIVSSFFLLVRKVKWVIVAS